MIDATHDPPGTLEPLPEPTEQLQLSEQDNRPLARRALEAAAI